MRVSYPALFYYDESEKTKYFVTFPDFENSATQGTDISDAMYMAADWLGGTVAYDIEHDIDIPKPSPINALSLVKNDPFKDDKDFKLEYDPEKSFISMVTVDLSEYLNGDTPIKKTLTIPKWADKIVHELNLNFSQTLTDAIMAHKITQG
ncbi:type II toxin-antitoxin system HicB family antitoxin [Lapidilactobacillus bayanensis]|uniref:type II toxin-antitoxin system HicB family antitoxin n=1 Tax=Lapidilactobacillus bayanensis TaxID=2485998 RepID=UPI000F76AB6E|nr:type II toxin-antitoxin system HicB family antitoxin [Lapidilactobacillus bayanensis]